MRKISLINNNEFTIEVIIEPAAEAFDLHPGQKALIVIEDSEKITDALEIEHSSRDILIYDGGQISFKIYVEEELMYYTDYSF